MIALIQPSSFLGAPGEDLASQVTKTCTSSSAELKGKLAELKAQTRDTIARLKSEQEAEIAKMHRQLDHFSIVAVKNKANLDQISVVASKAEASWS